MTTVKPVNKGYQKERQSFYSQVVYLKDMVIMKCDLYSEWPLIQF